jgi:hypothetical protein
MTASRFSSNMLPHGEGQNVRGDPASVIAPCAAAKCYENIKFGGGLAWGDAMTPEEALRNILSLVNGSDEVEDVHALQILLQSIGTLAEKGLGRSE